MYDPRVGRWLSEDPLGFTAGDANVYRYVLNSPTNFTDPSGLFSLPPIRRPPPGGGDGTDQQPPAPVRPPLWPPVTKEQVFKKAADIIDEFDALLFNINNTIKNLQKLKLTNPFLVGMQFALISAFQSYGDAVVGAIADIRNLTFSAQLVDSVWDLLSILADMLSEEKGIIAEGVVLFDLYGWFRKLAGK
jgi:hypothetical protein